MILNENKSSEKTVEARIKISGEPWEYSVRCLPGDIHDFLKRFGKEEQQAKKTATIQNPTGGKNPMNSTYNVDTLRDFADKIPNSRNTPDVVEGRRKTIMVASYALHNMSLDEPTAIETIYEWNRSLQWPWEKRDLDKIIRYVKENYNPDIDPNRDN